MTRKMRQRLWIQHRVTVTQECALDLHEFGIPTFTLPVEMGGYFHEKDQFQEWLQDIVLVDELLSREKD